MSLLSYPCIRLLGDLDAAVDPKTMESPVVIFYHLKSNQSYGIFKNATADKINNFYISGKPLVYYLTETSRICLKNFIALNYCLANLKANPNVICPNEIHLPTPLFIAAQDVCSIAVCLLLQCNANALFKNKEGQTAIQYMFCPAPMGPPLAKHKDSEKQAPVIEEMIAQAIEKARQSSLPPPKNVAVGSQQ